MNAATATAPRTAADITAADSVASILDALAETPAGCEAILLGLQVLGRVHLCATFSPSTGGPTATARRMLPGLLTTYATAPAGTAAKAGARRVIDGCFATIERWSFGNRMVAEALHGRRV